MAHFNFTVSTCTCGVLFTVQYLQPVWDDFCQYDRATFIEMSVCLCSLSTLNCVCVVSYLHSSGVYSFERHFLMQDIAFYSIQPPIPHVPRIRSNQVVIHDKFMIGSMLTLHLLGIGSRVQVASSVRHNCIHRTIQFRIEAVHSLPVSAVQLSRCHSDLLDAVLNVTVCCAQTVPRSSKEAAVQKEKDSRLGSVVDARRTEGQPQEAEMTLTDEQAAYVSTWRLDNTLQLAADISNICTYLLVLSE